MEEKRKDFIVAGRPGFQGQVPGKAMISPGAFKLLVAQPQSSSSEKRQTKVF